MSSGFGLKGNVSKCYPHFQDFVSCMKTSDEPLKSCGVLRDDYFECLHNKNAAARTDAIKKQEEINASGGAGKSSGGGHH